MTMRWLVFGLSAVGVVCLGGCRSAYVEADVVNATGAAVTLVEVDYPSASFGVESLAAGTTFNYRFKVLGSGPTKVMWTDAARVDHTAAGPELREGQQGTLTVMIEGGTAEWKTDLKP
jgi:hypothetical protein